MTSLRAANGDRDRDAQRNSIAAEADSLGFGLGYPLWAPFGQQTPLSFLPKETLRYLLNSSSWRSHP